MRRAVIAPALLAPALAGCDDLVGFGGEAPPLATVHVAAMGDFEAVRVPGAAGEQLRIALVWGAQWLPEPLCILPTTDGALAAVIAAGCRNPLSFTPARVAASVAVAPNAPAELAIQQLPAADVMVGDLTARVAYGSLVVFDDRDGDGTLHLARPAQLPSGPFDDGGDGPDGDDDDGAADIVYGASFVAMTEADRRVAFREGGFVPSGFYPRRSCGEPPRGFSILSAGGFTFEAAVAATLANELPAQDPASCAEDDPDATVVEIALRRPPEVQEVACRPRRLDSSVRYLDPPAADPVGDRAFACTSIPSFGQPDPATAGITQLVVASGDGEPCDALTHYTLVGCSDGELRCDRYEWDFRANPPAWWPCEVAP